MWPLNLVDASYLGEGEEGLALDVAPDLVDAGSQLVHLSLDVYNWYKFNFPCSRRYKKSVVLIIAHSLRVCYRRRQNLN